MRATLRLPRAASYADYLAVEENSDHRHELIDGVIVATAGGSDEHNAISGRLAMLLGMRLSDQCRYYSPDQRFWIAASHRARYADGSVICGRPEHPAHDRRASINPVLLIEVLSPTSEGDDDGEKRADFQSIDSLQAYVLVSQDERLVKVHRRDEHGGWNRAPEIYRDGAQLSLHPLGAPLPVGEIYAGILDGQSKSLLR